MSLFVQISRVYGVQLYSSRVQVLGQELGAGGSWMEFSILTAWWIKLTVWWSGPEGF